MEFLTDFADQAVVLPIAFATAMLFAWSQWWRGLGAWLLAVGGVLGTILSLKIVFEACPAVASETGILSPSGHTASACVVYGGIILLLLRNVVPLGVLALLAAAIAALFGFSRLALQVHTPGDVIVGACVGMAGILALVFLAGPVVPRPRGVMVVITVLFMIALHGLHLPAELAIRNFARSNWIPMPSVCRLTTAGGLQTAIPS